MSKCIGIDLGTTNTAVAVVIDGRPRVLEDEKGYKVLPSCVSSKGAGRYIIGQAAKNLILSSPDRTVYAIKRLIGRRFDSPEVTRARRRMGFDIEEAADGGVQVRLGDEVLTPTEISSIILQVAKQIAERALQEPVDEAVITVPAYFTHAQRQCTMEAAHLAGLRCERLINEPTAAALAYGFRKEVDRTLCIFDLGGGTFDVCVLRLSSGVYEILATSGDSYLGGEDFDYRLVDHLADHFQSEHAFDLREDRVSHQRLKDAAERAKCELSFTDRTTVLVPRIAGTTNLEMVVSRQTLEGLVDDLVARTAELARRTVTDAGLQLGQIDDVVLVGGQTRMPKVREAIAGLFGREPSRSVHPEEAVAVGAAVHGGSLSDATVAAPLLLDVTPFDLGIDTVGGMFSPVIGRNSKIPVSRTRTFATVHENQDKVRVTVRQGEAPRAEENEFLGEFVMEGITPAARMEAKVEVTFRLDANGMLHVQAVEQGTGEKKQISIRNYAEVAAALSQENGTAVSPQVDAPVEEVAELLDGEHLEPMDEDDPSGASPVGAPQHVALAAAPGTADDGAVPTAADVKAPKKSRSLFASIFGHLRRGKKTDPSTAEPAPLLPRDGLVVSDEISVAELEELEEGVLQDELVDDGYDKDVQLVGARPSLSEGEDLESLEAGDDLVGEDIRIDLSSITPDPEIMAAETLLPLDEVADGDVNTTVDDEIYPPGVGSPASVGLAGEGADAEDLFALPEDENPFDDDLDPFKDVGNFEDLGPDLLDEGLISALPARNGKHTEQENDPGAREQMRGDRREFGRPNSDEALGAVDDELDAMLRQFEAEAGLLPDPLDPPPPTLAPTPVMAEPDFPASAAGDGDETPEAEDRKKSRKPARLKMHYRSFEAFMVDYRENLRRGGTFIRTPKPLPVGRDCLFEIHAPGLDAPLTFPGVVNWSSRGLDTLPAGQERGMGIEFRMTDETRTVIENALDTLA